MSEEELAKKVLSNTYTLQDARSRLNLAGRILERKFFGKEEAWSELDEAEKENLMEWGEEFWQQFSSENIYDKIEKIYEEISRYPVINVYVPKSIPAGKKEEIGKWLRNEVQEKLLINLHIDDSMIAGCGFIWNENYYDFSFQRSIKFKRDEILEMIKEHGKLSNKK